MIANATPLEGHLAKSRSRCPACDSADTKSIYTVRHIPVHSCVLLNSPTEAKEFATSDLELAFCHACGFVYNRLFDESVMSYSTNFEESQHFSDTFNGFAKGLAAEIADECRTAGKCVVEIGCGKGEFLLELCRIGNCTGIGIDPGFRWDRIDGKDVENVRFVTDFFGPSYYHLDADVVLCRHTLEHIPNVLAFVESTYQLVRRQSDAAIVFETPDVERVLREGAFWDIYHEHCSYFSAGTHARLFRRCGFDVNKLNLVYDRQYIVQNARAARNSLRESTLPLEDDLDEMRRLADEFPDHVESIKSHWLNLIRHHASQGETTVLWGGSSKGVSFLTTLGLRDEVECVVDVNPFKQGKYMPGTGHPIVAPEALVESPPSLVIVMNPIYLDEIRGSLNSLGISPELVAV